LTDYTYFHLGPFSVGTGLLYQVRNHGAKLQITVGLQYVQYSSEQWSWVQYWVMFVLASCRELWIRRTVLYCNTGLFRKSTYQIPIQFLSYSLFTVQQSKE